MNKIAESIKRIKAKDALAPLLLILAVIPAIIYKIMLAIKKKPLWLICEDGKTARDNGYYFYRYLCDKRKNINCRYVVDKKSFDYGKIHALGKKPIRTSSFEHYVLYLAAKWNISNQKCGNPNPLLFYIIHVVFGLIRNRVFLQHGVITNDTECYHYKEAKFKYFVTSVKREHNFICDHYGYPDGSIIMTGLPRFDSLIDDSSTKKQLLIMPTWRKWMGMDTNALDKKQNFKSSLYYESWNGLLTSKNFIDYIEQNRIHVLFYPHQNMQKYLEDFDIKSKNIELANMDTDIQKAIRESYLMITDYSSVSIDFAYLRKPVIYYQFDQAEFREKHLSYGYFDYEKDGFGPVCMKCDDVLKAMRDDKTRNKYLSRAKSFFDENDYKNCDRLYEVLNNGK